MYFLKKTYDTNVSLPEYDFEMVKCLGEITKMTRRVYVYEMGKLTIYVRTGIKLHGNIVMIVVHISSEKYNEIPFMWAATNYTD